MTENSQHPPNRLAEETSPYLLQHARNPVDWHPWGPEALEKARSLNKPIFLSVGYSACHWCHVMEHESFENHAIAHQLNNEFICIKVDREERPDIDQIYMNVVQLMTGRGGWPMSVFLKPDLTPIFAGTYFPPDDRYGVPGFTRVLSEVSRIFKENPQALARQTQEILQALNKMASPEISSIKLTAESLDKSGHDLLRHHDARNGGFGGAPKFPQTMALNFLLQLHERTKQASYLNAVTLTLRRMGEGGIYDHLGGGFARYSVDQYWAVPHFEKMLYDNALLADIYFKTFQASGDGFFRTIGCGILDYVLSEMTDEAGGFFSSEDADSEGEEGKFYVWDPQEIKEVLGDKDGDLLCRYFGVDKAGNFEGGKTVLAIHRQVEDLVREEGAKQEDLAGRLASAQKKLFEARHKRVRPGRDEKILVSWNALMIRGFARGFQVTGDLRYCDAAKKAVQFILNNMTYGEQKERLWATAKGRKVKELQAYLDDYAYLVAALLDLFEATGELQWLKPAELFLQSVLRFFPDKERGGFYFTASDHEKLLQRPKSLFDASIPSGNAVMLENLLRFSIIKGGKQYEEAYQQLSSLLVPLALEHALGMTQSLVVAERQLGPQKEIVLVGKKAAPEFIAAQNCLGQAYWPRALIVLAEEGEKALKDYAGLNDLLSGKSAQGRPFTAYICEARSCGPPLSTLEALKEYALSR